MLENCFSCKAIGKYYPYEFYKSINEMEDLLNKLEKEEQKREKGNMIDNLSNKLIYIDNRLMLCEGCKRKKSDKLMDKLINTLNKLTNKSYLSVEITRLSNELLETLEMLEN